MEGTAVNPYRVAGLRWARRRSFIPVGRFVLRPLDMAFRRLGLARLFGRPFSAIGSGVPSAYLITIGRRSGEPRTTPVLPVDVPCGVGLIATNWGQDRRPGWYHNLTANPECRLERGRESRRYRARSGQPEERAEIWRRAVEVYPPWEAYAERIERELDIFVLEPVEASRPVT